jgi:hypothetical protein
VAENQGGVDMFLQASPMAKGVMLKMLAELRFIPPQSLSRRSPFTTTRFSARLVANRHTRRK